MEAIVDGLHIKGSDEGRGPIVLLLHGWGTDHKNLMGFMGVFNGKRVIAPDLPGFGGSQIPEQIWDVGDYAKFVVTLLQKLAIDKVETILGHSFGGRIALELVGNGLVKPDKLILLSSHGLPERPTFRTKAILTAAKASRILPSAFRQKAGSRFRSADYQATSGRMQEIFLRVIKQDAARAAQQISVPTLLIYGQNDETTPLSMGKSLHRLIKGSRFEVVEAAGHYVHLDQPARIAGLIKGFVT